MIVVSDTSPISNLLLIGRLDLLHDVFGEVYIPQAVQEEILALENFGFELINFLEADWISLRMIQDKSKLSALQVDLDEGESEAIVLAQEISADWILMDERAGTKIAEQWGLHPIGLIGLLIKAKQKGLISSVVEVIEELRTKAGFWVSDRLLQRIKQELSE